MEPTARMTFEYPNIFDTLPVVAAQTIIEPLPDLLQIQDCLACSCLVRVLVGCNRHKTPGFMTEALVKGVQQIGTP